MAKKVNIVGVTTKEGTIYSVGRIVDPQIGQVAAERIVFEPHGYNKGKQGNFPAYVVFSEGSNIRKIIPQDCINEFAAELIEEEEAIAEVVVDLPEG